MVHMKLTDISIAILLQQKLILNSNVVQIKIDLV